MLFVKFNTGLEVYYDLLMMLDLFTQSTEYSANAEKVKPLLVAAGKTREGKASSFAQIRDFLKKKHKPNKTEFATWTSENILEKWNNYEA